MAGEVNAPGPARTVLVFGLGGVAWAALGTAATALIASTESANPVLIFSYLPGQPVIAAATRALEFSGPGLAPVSGRDLAVLAGWAMIGLVASVRFFRWDPVRPAHTSRAAPATVSSPGTVS